MPKTRERSDLSVVVDRAAAGAYVARFVPAYGAVRFANEYLPPETRILSFEDGFNCYSQHPVLLWYSAMARPSLVERPATPVLPDADETRVPVALRDLHITHVLLPRNLDSLRRLELVITEEDFMARYLVPIYHDDRAVLFEVASQPQAPPTNTSSGA